MFGVGSWVFQSSRLVCDFGTAYATLNPVALDFIAYQTACPLLPRSGVCDGAVAVRCATPDEGGYRELRTECAQLVLACGVDPGTSTVGCVDPAP